MSVGGGEVGGTGRSDPVGVAKGRRQEVKAQRKARTHLQPPARTQLSHQLERNSHTS